LTISTPHITAVNDPASPPFGAFVPTRAQAAIISLAHRSRLKRGAFRPMLSRLVNLLRAGPIDVQYQGASFRFHHQASATERGALFNPGYNLDELDFLRVHAPTGGVFVDVGANVGTYAMVLARHIGPGGKVIAIEPHPVTHARLAFNRAASRLEQVTLVAAAAGPSDGELLIETDGDNLGASQQRHQGAVAPARAHSRRGGDIEGRRAEDRRRRFRRPRADRLLPRRATGAVAARGRDRAPVEAGVAFRLHRRHARARLP
jgi:FkbM family methyltransferase